MLIPSWARRLLAACCGVLALTACNSAPATAPPPTSGIPSPATPSPGATTPRPYTSTGTTLRIGQSAVVPWQDSDKPGSPVGALRLAVIAVSSGQTAGPAYPDPDASPSFNDVMFLVRISATNSGTIPVHPGGLFGLVTTYDTSGDPMTPATTTDQGCTSSPGSDDALPAGGRLTACKAYLGSVLAPHIAKVVFSGFADPGVTITITWTNGSQRPDSSG